MSENKHKEIYNCEIYYEDVDIGGYCYHSKYLNFCERARSDIFFKKNLSPINGEYHFVAKSLEANFKSPGFFGDKVTVYTSVIEQKTASVILFQEIVNLNGITLFEMKIILACLKNNKVSKIPDIFKNIFVS